MIIYRKLTHDDYEDIADLSKDIWEGTDYLPKVFHKWVDDKGIFLGAIDSDRNKVAAVAKLSMLSDGSGWLEGLRVHIDYRGQKLAKKITEQLLNTAKVYLKEKKINRIAFSTHISNVESRNMMEKFSFKLIQAHVLAVKKLPELPGCEINSKFHVEPWNISYEDFKQLSYFTKRNGLLPLAFVFQEITPELFQKLKEDQGLVIINNHPGIFKYKGEPNFLAIEDSFDAIDTFMNYYISKYMTSGLQEIYTPILSEDKSLMEKLISSHYYSWSNWEPDYLYYVYESPLY